MICFELCSDVSSATCHACKSICNFYNCFTSCIALGYLKNSKANVQILTVSIIKDETFQIFCQTTRNLYFGSKICKCLNLLT